MLDGIKRQTLWISGAIVGLMAAQTALFHWQGRVWWCACGRPTLWEGDVWGAHNSQHVADPYTFSHILHGVIFYWVLKVCVPRLSAAWCWFIALAVEIGWEVLENSPLVINRYRAATAAQGYFGDSIVNSLSDVVFCGFGFWLAGVLGWKKSLLLFIVLEVGCALIVRDNLTLNVLMLLCPIDAVKEWQMGHG